MVRKLKMFFNAKFTSVFDEKEEILAKILQLNERLKAVILELRQEYTKTTPHLLDVMWFKHLTI